MNQHRQSAQLLRAIAHPARLRLLCALRDGEECVCHLTTLLRQRQAYVSQQLMFLRQAGLIEDRKDGLRVYYRIKDARVFDVVDAANAIAGVRNVMTEAQVLEACPCPKCGVHRQGKGGRRWRSKPLGRVVPTA
jgi:DNA-binding transcriptional ArsR family regulator